MHRIYIYIYYINYYNEKKKYIWYILKYKSKRERMCVIKNIYYMIYLASLYDKF